MKSLLIINGKVYEAGKLVEKNILLEDNWIREVTEDRPTVDDVLDVEGKTILPGLIDSHVHIREPGLTHKEDFFTGSKAAAIGGVTTFLDMPNTNPPTTTIELLNQKKKLAEKSIVNFGFHFGSTADNINQIANARGIASVKVYMDSTTGNFTVDKDENLTSIFSAAKRISVHAESHSVQKALDIFKSIDNKKKKLYFCHISTEEELKMIKKAKKANIFIEATPHHLFLTNEDDKDSFTKMKPGLKPKQDQDALWQALNKGIIDTIATDHAPHTVEEKKGENPPYGVPGLETMLPLLLNAVNLKKLTLQRMVELTSENPAKIFQLKNKGYIKEGYDADLVIVDMDVEKEVKNEELKTKCGWSPFNGWKLKGWPIMTIINGNLIYNKGILSSGIKGKGVSYYEQKSRTSTM